MALPAIAAALAPLLEAAAAWLLREVIIKAFVFAAVFAVVSLLMPKVISYVTPYLGFNPVKYFSAHKDIIYWMNVLEFVYGFNMAVSAITARFIIRRIPFVG